MSVMVASTRLVAPTGSLSPPAPKMARNTASESVAVGGVGRFQRPLVLNDQRVGGRGHVLFQRDSFAAIGDPAAHGSCSEARHIYLRRPMRQSNGGGLISP